MFQKISLAVLVVLVVAAAAVAVTYLQWRSDRFEELRSGSQIAETGLGPIEYVMRGEVGPVILFLHGAPGGYDQAPAELLQGFRLLAPSRPGYLFTPLELGRAPADQAQAFVALLDLLEIERVIVMGISAGGRGAISFAALYPERTVALVTLEAISQPDRKNTKTPLLLKSDFLFWAILSAALGNSGAEGIVLDQVPDPENQLRILGDPSKLHDFAKLMWSIGPPSLRMPGWRNDMRQFENLELSAGDVRVPTLILHGTADALVPFSHSKTLARQIPGARFYAIEGADHFMPISHKETVNGIIEAFLREQVERAGDR